MKLRSWRPTRRGATDTACRILRPPDVLQAVASAMVPNGYQCTTGTTRMARWMGPSLRHRSGTLACIHLCPPRSLPWAQHLDYSLRQTSAQPAASDTITRLLPARRTATPPSCPLHEHLVTHTHAGRQPSGQTRRRQRPNATPCRRSSSSARRTPRRHRVSSPARPARRKPRPCDLSSPRLPDASPSRAARAIAATLHAQAKRAADEGCRKSWIRTRPLLPC